MNNIYNKSKFLKTVVELGQLPADCEAEIGFIGRSNAGKSSSMNAITNIKGLARTSKTPGRTQALNFFEVDKQHRLVDLPGYGYAKVPLSMKQRWEALVNTYLQQRECLRGLVLVMDIRHPLKELDEKLIEWAVHCELPTHILLTKCDKLKSGQARKVLREVEAAVDIYHDMISVQLFSANDKTGVPEARQLLNEWFELEGS